MAKPSKFFGSYCAECQYIREHDHAFVQSISYSDYTTLTLLAVGVEDEVIDDGIFDDSVDDSDQSLTKGAVALMRKNLPKYVVKSFITAGYDTHEVIAELKTDDEPGHSLDEIESYINKACVGESRFHREGVSSTLCKIPPAHGRRITKFVKEVVQPMLAERKSQKRRLMKNDALENNTCKRKKHRSLSSTSSSSDLPSDEVSCQDWLVLQSLFDSK